MTAFLDTNILIALLREEELLHEWCVATVERYRAEGPSLISDIVFCEFAAGMPNLDSVVAAISELALERVRASDMALFRAGEAFKKYKGQRGEKSNVLPDFLIGAEAATHGVPLITTNPKDFVRYFPEVQVVCPRR